ncbi:MAG: HPr kinase/phosphatase C-terminal domain-containing protein [Roseobacter sp.]|jgi:HPr kinase/phosphorylase|nr:HPr kinase/phosphatase C-terminal domain-containing protein [Roseobacter sp.]
MYEDLVHASCVDVDGTGVLIVGASGTGKSALALHLMSLGARLVADDRVVLLSEGTSLTARSPATIKGMVEARSVGILRADTVSETTVVLVVDLDTEERERLPDKHMYEICNHRLPCLRAVHAPYFPAAILQMLKCGRQDPP